MQADSPPRVTNQLPKGLKHWISYIDSLGKLIMGQHMQSKPRYTSVRQQTQANPMETSESTHKQFKEFNKHLKG